MPISLTTNNNNNSGGSTGSAGGSPPSSGGGGMSQHTLTPLHHQSIVSSNDESRSPQPTFIPQGYGSPTGIKI